MWGDGTPWEAIPPNLRQSMIDKIDVVDAGTPALHQDTHGLLGPTGLANYKGPALFIRANAAFQSCKIFTLHWSN